MWGFFDFFNLFIAFNDTYCCVRSDNRASSPIFVRIYTQYLGYGRRYIHNADTVYHLPRLKGITVKEQRYYHILRHVLSVIELVAAVVCHKDHGIFVTVFLDHTLYTIHRDGYLFKVTLSHPAATVSLLVCLGKIQKYKIKGISKLQPL